MPEGKGIPLASLDYRKFGAVIDGVTNDTAAVQAAIDDFVMRQSSAGTNSLSDPQAAHLTTMRPPCD
jgi:polygalacturonase